MDVQQCHAGYKYNNFMGQCVFSYSLRSGLRQDRNNKYLYVQVNNQLHCIFHAIIICTIA